MLVDPTSTSPKVTVLGLAERLALAGGGVFAVINPAHPDRIVIARITAKDARDLAHPLRRVRPFPSSEHTNPVSFFRTDLPGA